uniref:Uncharacterized protein n=1 Tax=Setaria viridis TaxID=4556 RepID=A0A4U6TKG3_SETVI|nr:hypothetical protein SEVIR_8G232400v2 [Setaria viridis]
MSKLQQPHLEFLQIIQSDNTKNECEYDTEDDQILTPKKCHGGGRRLGGHLRGCCVRPPASELHGVIAQLLRRLSSDAGLQLRFQGLIVD